MSNAIEDERRLYQCARKYRLIGKQFDELVAMLNNKAKASKRRKVPSGNQNTTSSQADDKDVLVQTITRFLQELRTNAKDVECSNET